MLLVRHIMKRNVLVLTEDATVKDTLDLMLENSAGSVVIVDKDTGRKPIGIVTERDILSKIVNFRKPLETPIKEIMSSPVITISPDEPIEKAAEIMTENRIKKLPVVEKGELVGIITLTDIVASGVKLEEAILKELAKWFPIRKRQAMGG